MKFYAVFMSVALAFIVNAGATDFSVQTSFFTQSTNLLSVSGNTTNGVTGNGFYVEQNCYHTMHVYCTSNLNGSTWTCDRSLDNTNWLSATTNGVGAGGGNLEFTLTGKFSYLRARQVTGTNTLGNALYLGGR